MTREGACLASVGLIAMLVGVLAAPARAQDQTWVERDGEIYGARPDERGPIGGGEGYVGIVTEGDYTATTLEELIDALGQAQPGEVVFIPGETEIDLTTFIYIDEFVLEIPAGVTLAGERGNGGSPGAILTSDALKTPRMIAALGPDVRVTGLRIRGPNPKRYLDHHRRAFREGYGGHTYYYKFPTQNGISTEHDALEVDNCDISGFGHAGIYLRTGEGHHVHHNYIHHCQYNGLGYGVSHNTAASLIEQNLFDWNRHSIAGTGRPGCSYIARNNVELGTSLSHCFDMHGGRDRDDGTDIAGTTIEIYNNTFRAPQTPVVIRGVPQDVCEVHHNWFVQHTPENAVRGSDRTVVRDNVYGEDAQPAAEQ
ncbi:MAG: right-handed parallel beta-helix repeat-containing protein [Armatimonadota bacterium]